MSKIWGIDHKVFAASALGITGGLALYSTYKLWILKRRQWKDNVYETNKYLNEYLIFHYGAHSEILPAVGDFGMQHSVDFPQRCAELCMKYSKKEKDVANRALDIGCAVGRSSFELTSMFDEVIGIDYSNSFINTCNKLKEAGRLPYSVTTEGELEKQLDARVPQHLDRGKAVFQQGDACNLPLDLGQFGCVLAANLICRLHTPRIFFDRLYSLVAPGGILVITSPYSFSTDYTPKENWIGAYQKHGRPFIAFEGMKEWLDEGFHLIAEDNLPFLIRETARKNQWTVAHATVWRRK